MVLDCFLYIIVVVIVVVIIIIYPYWRIGEVYKWVAKKKKKKKGIFFTLNHFLCWTGILNIRHIQEFIGAQTDGAKVR